MTRLLPLFALLGLLLSACQPPPPAPEGLDEASGFVIREFYSDDTSFEVGIQGFMNWFFDEGERLLGLTPGFDEDDEPTDSFTIENLTDEDVAKIPESEARDLTLAEGVVSLAEMDCSWKVVEDFLVRGDQYNVFSTWEGYDRTYLSDQDAYNRASDTGIFPSINDALDPHFDPDFSRNAWSGTFLFTTNQADPAPTLNGLVDIEPYELFFDMRHGVFDLTDQSTGQTSPTGVVAVLTYITETALDAEEANGLGQQFSVEINVERPGDKTLRMLAVWGEPRNNMGYEPDDPVILNGTVRMSMEASDELNGRCSEVEETGCSTAAGSPAHLWLSLLLLLPLLRRRREP